MINSNKFNWLVVDNQTDQVIAGFYNKEVAEAAAATLKGYVKEAALVEMSGDMWITSNGDVFFDGDSLGERIREVMGVKVVGRPRGGTPSLELGYVTIVIKPASKPGEEEDVEEQS